VVERQLLIMLGRTAGFSLGETLDPVRLLGGLGRSPHFFSNAKSKSPRLTFYRQDNVYTGVGAV